MSKSSLVSIIIVNYNSKNYIKECLNSLQNINFPKKKYEIIMVDNNSQDTSLEYTKKNFPDIRIIESTINLGFAAGCNLGVSYAKGEYVAFLNTDTKVEPNWLYHLVKRVESDKQIAAVNSKILLFYPFIKILIKSDVYLRSEFTNSIDFHTVGVLLENILLDDPSLQSHIRYSKGFYEKEVGSIPSRWTQGEATVIIPCDPRQSTFGFTFTIRSEKSATNLKTKVVVKLGNKNLVEDILNSYEVKQYRIMLTAADIKKYFLYAVQNSGVVVFRNGYGRDRGAVVKKDGTNFFELNNPFYDEASEIISFCGASALIRKDLFKKMGGFDPLFFMYYEDVDLSLRLRRSGWKIYYEPKSVIYHIHAASSSEWSSFFIFHVEKNHLALLIKHFPWVIFAKELFIYLFVWIVSVMKMVKWRTKEDWVVYEEAKEKAECRTNVLVWLFNNFFSLVRLRLNFSKINKISISTMYKQLY